MAFKASQIFFAYVVATLLVLSSMVSFAAAHGHISTSINGNIDARNTQNNVNKCGVKNRIGEQAFKDGKASPMTVKRGEEFTYQFQITNADGAGPLSVKIDPSCAGDTFSVTADVTSQIPGTAGLIPAGTVVPKFYDFKVRFPKELTCTCGDTKDLCLMQITTPLSFASCAFIRAENEKPKAPEATASPMAPQPNYMFSPGAMYQNQNQYSYQNQNQNQYSYQNQYGYQNQNQNQYGYQNQNQNQNQQQFRNPNPNSNSRQYFSSYANSYGYPNMYSAY